MDTIPVDSSSDTRSFSFPRNFRWTVIGGELFFVGFTIFALLLPILEPGEGIWIVSAACAVLFGGFAVMVVPVLRLLNDVVTVGPEGISYVRPGRPEVFLPWGSIAEVRPRDGLHTFALYCVEKGYLAENTIAKLPKYKINNARSTAETLTASQVEGLMRFLENCTGPSDRRPTVAQPKGFLVPFFALALFAGIRPDWQHGEISKITPEAVDLDAGVIRIEPGVSKTNEKRVIAIQPNLRLWLARYPLKEYPQIPQKNIDRVLREVRKKFSLGHDVLRHTYISMLVGAFRSVGDAALQAGNSETVIRKHYLDLKSVAEADNFWRICPAGKSLPETFEKKDGRYVFVQKVKKADEGSEALAAV